MARRPRGLFEPGKLGCLLCQTPGKVRQQIKFRHGLRGARQSRQTCGQRCGQSHLARRDGNGLDGGSSFTPRQRAGKRLGRIVCCAEGTADERHNRCTIPNPQIHQESVYRHLHPGQPGAAISTCRHAQGVVH